ncbi:MAG: DUF448 domain-containing protein [Myxococcota bacterium]
MPPVRSCIACRERGAPDELIRLVRHPDTGEVLVDLATKLPGRGAWVHCTRSCVQAVCASPAALSRAFKAKVQCPDLSTRLAEQLRLAALQGVSMASASGSLVGGHDRLTAALRAQELRQVILATDAAERTLKSIRTAASDDVIFVSLGVGRDTLGERTGRGARAALGVLPTRGSAYLQRQLRRLRDLG